MHREKTCYCIASAPQKVNTITSRKLENSSSSKIELHEPIEAPASGNLIRFLRPLSNWAHAKLQLDDVHQKSNRPSSN